MVSMVRIDARASRRRFCRARFWRRRISGFQPFSTKRAVLILKSLEYKTKGAEESIEYPTDRADGTALSSQGITESAGQKQPKAAGQEGDETILIQALVEVDYPLLFQTDTALSVNTLMKRRKNLRLWAVRTASRPGRQAGKPSAENRPDFCAAVCETGAGEPFIQTLITAQTVGRAAEKPNAADTSGGLGFAEKPMGKQPTQKPTPRLSARPIFLMALAAESGRLTGRK